MWAIFIVETKTNLLIVGFYLNNIYKINTCLFYEQVLAAMGVTWISSLILGLPAAISGLSYTYSNSSFFCVPSLSKSTFSIYYSIVHTIVAFILPLLLILTCNMRVSTIWLFITDYKFQYPRIFIIRFRFYFYLLTFHLYALTYGKHHGCSFFVESLPSEASFLYHFTEFSKYLYTPIP